MLTELRIKNLAILDQVELLLEPGFNVFTGETGAGKSMIVQAVHLLMGARASEDLVRTGAAEAEIEARFETESREPWGAWLAEREVPFAGELLLRRVVSRGGRSRSYLNEQGVTLKFLTAAVQELLHLSGQHDTKLFSPRKITSTFWIFLPGWPRRSRIFGPTMAAGVKCGSSGRNLPDAGLIWPIPGNF